MSSVFLAPHCDDETLFGAFTLIRDKPHVVVVYDCGVQREAETRAACAILAPGCSVEFWRRPADDPAPLSRFAGFDGTLYAPLVEVGGQPQHNRVGDDAILIGAPVIEYCTYTERGKSSYGTPVAYEPAWVAKKLAALSCYPSQSGHPSHAPHFMRDQTEFYA